MSVVLRLPSRRTPSPATVANVQAFATDTRCPPRESCTLVTGSDIRMCGSVRTARKTLPDFRTGRHLK